MTGARSSSAEPAPAHRTIYGALRESAYLAREFARPLIATLGFMLRRFRRYVMRLSVGGMIMGLLFFCFSMTPSLLPRPWYLQGVASGICMTTGYAVGVIISWILRKFGFRPLAHHHHRRLIMRVLTIAACVLVPVFGGLGALWQYQVRSITHSNLGDSDYYALVLLIAFVVGRTLLSVARLLRTATRRVGQFGARWVPLPVAKLIAAGLVGFLAVTIVDDALFPVLLRAANASFSLVDSGTAEGVHQPSNPDRSGSPASLAKWSDLGKEGRSFVAKGPDAAQIARFKHGPAVEPIRVYAGLDSSETLHDEVRLVIDELHRTHAFDRAVLVVATTTGRGWVNEVAAEAIEYLWGGDTAIAAMQYSYLPSPVAFLADRSTPPKVGRMLFDAVHAEWAKLPPKKRPILLVTGESLGSFGSQGAFDSLADFGDEADGAVWAGTVNSTPLWRSVTADRDPGSPEQIPRIDDCAHVCFMASPTDLPPAAHPSVVYLQHVNDPIVWWSPDLLLQRPAWLKEPALPGRTSSMTWIPFVTFWQVTADMVFSTDMPKGYGHEYALAYVDAFATVAPPPNWTKRDTARLKKVLASVSTGG